MAALPLHYDCAKPKYHNKIHKNCEGVLFL